ncbi:MAG: hypothetical protein WCL30_00695 [Pseudomonadota bacterium]
MDFVPPDDRPSGEAPQETPKVVDYAKILANANLSFSSNFVPINYGVSQTQSENKEKPISAKVLDAIDGVEQKYQKASQFVAGKKDELVAAKDNAVAKFETGVDKAKGMFARAKEAMAERIESAKMSIRETKQNVSMAATAVKNDLKDVVKKGVEIAGKGVNLADQGLQAVGKATIDSGKFAGKVALGTAVIGVNIADQGLQAVGKATIETAKVAGKVAVGTVSVGAMAGEAAIDASVKAGKFVARKGQEADAAINKAVDNAVDYVDTKISQFSAATQAKAGALKAAAADKFNAKMETAAKNISGLKNQVQTSLQSAKDTVKAGVALKVEEIASAVSNSGAKLSEVAAKISPAGAAQTAEAVANLQSVVGTMNEVKGSSPTTPAATQMTSLEKFQAGQWR